MNFFVQTPITAFVLITTTILSIMAFRNREMFDKFKFNSYMVAQKKDYVRLFSHALLHADWMHLIINMLVLYMFGCLVEQYFVVLFPKAGKFLYMLMYITAVPLAALPALIKNRNNSYYNSVGASGAVSAILFASILFDPTQEIMFLLLPIPMPAFVFGLIYLVYSWFMSKKQIDNVAHDAHFAGAVFGFIFPLLFQPFLFLRFIDLIFN